jgi:hypothetical protein
MSLGYWRITTGNERARRWILSDERMTIHHLEEGSDFGPSRSSESREQWRQPEKYHSWC